MTNSLFTLPVDDIRAMYAVEGRKTRLNKELKGNPFKHVVDADDFRKDNGLNEKPTD